MKKGTYLKILLIFSLIIVLLLPSLIGSGRLIAPGFLTETEIEIYINNSDFGFSRNLAIWGNSTFNGTLMPITSLTFDIGSGPLRWRNLYVTDISADNIDAIGNITGSYFFGDGAFLTNLNVSGNVTFGEDIWMSDSGFIVRAPGGGSVRLNITTGGDIYTAGTWYNDGNLNLGGEFVVDIINNYINTSLVFNTTKNINVNGANVTANWFKGLFNWIINATGVNTKYLNFNGSDLSFNEGQLNATIDDKISGINTSQSIQNLGFYNKSDLKINNEGWVAYTRTVDTKNVTMTAIR